MHSAKRSTSTRWLNALALTAAALAVSAVAWKNSQPHTILLSTSSDAARQLFRDLSRRFVEGYEGDAGFRLAVKESPVDADVVTVALPSDVNAMQRKGLVAAGWANRLPDRSQPFTSTIVFLVRKGNPKSIRDWPDLVRKGVTLAAPDPKTSSAGKVGVLAAWGSVVRRGGTESDATEYLSRLFKTTPAPEESFMRHQMGDILLTWENEALLASAGSHGELEVVYPPVSILAEPAVAWVDSFVAQHHTEGPAKAYLQFLFTAPAQEIMAKHGYRPADPAVLQKYRKQFPQIDLFPITAIARDWDDASKKFFGDAGILGQVQDRSHPILTARK